MKQNNTAAVLMISQDKTQPEISYPEFNGHTNTEQSNNSAMQFMTFKEQKKHRNQYIKNNKK